MRVLEGDCVELMAAMDAGSVDAVVCDPPYGLEFMGKTWDRLGDIGKVSHAGPKEQRDGKAAAFGRVAFNGSSNVRCRTCDKWKWGHKPGDGGGGGLRCQCEQPDFPSPRPDQARLMQRWHQAWATEALRVLKPGGHLLRLGGTRTYHRLACAVEDAGFEVRDMVAWMYGSGFPKSLSVGKAIDRADDTRRPEREALGRWLRAQREAAGLSDGAVAAHWPSVTGGLTGCVRNWEGGFNCPTLEQWADLKRIIGLPDDMDAEVWRLNGRKGQPGENWELREKVGEADLPVGHAFAGPTYGGDSSSQTVELTAPATPEAQRWEGWGTALKPAHEPVVVARKPLSGTVAQTVLEHGVGGLNIDGCRVEGSKPHREVVNQQTNSWDGGGQWKSSGVGAGESLVGRWPANVVLDEEAGAMLDQQTADLAGAVSQTPSDAQGVTSFGAGNNLTVYGDSGGASRFFYCAKASRAERNAGLDGFEEKPQYKAGGVGGTGGKRDVAEAVDAPWVTNHHPTVKPVALMRWLVRLVCSPGGLVLDPFTGSGTTGMACVLEGMDFIGCEREPEYVEIARARIAHVQEHGDRYLTPPAEVERAPGQLGFDWDEVA